MIGEAKHGAGSQRDTDSAVLAVSARRADPLTNTENGEIGPNRTVADLTRAERRVLTVLCDPANHALTEAQRIKLARVSRSSWFRITADPDIARFEREMIRMSIRASVGAVVHKSLTVAVQRDRDGFNDRRMLLEMSGHYTPRQQVEHTGGAVVGVVGVSMDAL